MRSPKDYRTYHVDVPGINRRKKLLPGEISAYSGNINGEVSRGHSSCRQRAVTDKRKTHRSNEGLKVKRRNASVHGKGSHRSILAGADGGAGERGKTGKAWNC